MYIYIYICTCIYMYTYIHTYIHTYMHKHIYTYIHIYMYTHISYIYIYSCTHTYTYTYTGWSNASLVYVILYYTNIGWYNFGRTSTRFPPELRPNFDQTSTFGFRSLVDQTSTPTSFNIYYSHQIHCLYKQVFVQELLK